ncbi:Glu-tRNA(Gln) amidotransferase subunit GatE [bacterium]|nr:Glu-tRNA(Gln) amidotransferase subunit GatE [bacterium]
MAVNYLSDEEYEALGLTSGIEIHQQIKTEKKLFCRCPVKMHRDNDYDAIVVRHMRPTLSELGEYDGTALMEFKTKKDIVYQLYHDCVCTYEMDDTPPFLINQNAVEIALQIAILLGCTTIDEVFITRKQYLDGSIPTGFQRTSIIGIDGEIGYRGKRIHIRQLGLEEDACREVSDIRHCVTFKADRLGTPLIEVVTERDMVTPLEVQGVAEQISMALKGTGLVNRGMGSVREDVNVSISGSTRVEIKGVDKLSLIGPLVHYEALRQKHLLELKDELKNRGVAKETLAIWDVDISKLADQLDSTIIQDALEAEPGSIVRAIGLRNMAGMLGHELQPNKPFAYEISQRIKVIACLDGEPNILFNDGEARTGDLSDDAWADVFSELDASKTDAVILVWGPLADVELAVSEVRLRVEDAISGVPNETRQASDDGTTGFERILPGPDRMYPDTDLPPFAISAERLENIKNKMAANPFETYERFRALGISNHAIRQLMRNRRWRLFDRVVKGLGIDLHFAVTLLAERLRAFDREGLNTSKLTDDDLFKVFDKFKQGKLSCEGAGWVIRDMLQNDDSQDLAIERFLLGQLDEKKIKELVSTQLAAKRTLIARLPADKAFNLLMGDLMHGASGKLEPRAVATALRAALSAIDEQG